MKERLDAELLIGECADPFDDYEVEISLDQFTVQGFRLRGCQMKCNAWIAPGESIDNRRDEACRQRNDASDSCFTHLRIGKKLDVLQPLAEAVEHGYPAIEQRTAIFGRFDALTMAVEQTHAERSLQLRD